MAVFSPSGQEIERQQCVSQPLFRRRKTLFWGRNFHLQLPLENMPDKSYVEVTLVGVPYGANPTPVEAKGIFTINLGSICCAPLDMPLNTIPALAARPVSMNGKNEAPAPVPSQFQLDSISHTVLNFSVSLTKINV